MRPVKEGKKPARRTARRGASSADGKGQVVRRTSSVSPGRRKTKSGAAFGRRGQRPPGRLSRIVEAVREGRLPKSLVAGSTGIFVSAAVVYGLAVGGHIAAAGTYVVTKIDAGIVGVGFRLSEVTVEGRARTSRADVLTALQVEQGQSIFGVDLSLARTSLLRLEWVEDVVVTRILPDRVHVELVERRPFAVWQRGGQLAIIDQQGRPITETGVDAYGHLPFVVGHGAAREAAAFTHLVAGWPELQARVRAYVRVGNRRWNLRLENGVDVLLPETGYEAALVDLLAIDATHRLLARDVEAIDMRLPDRFTVRLSPDAARRRDAATLEWERRSQRGGDT